MRPGGLGQILDDARDVIVAFDQKHVAGPERSRQRARIARRERLVARDGLLQIPGNHLPEAIEHATHDGFPSSRARFTLVSLWTTSLVNGRCVSVHGCGERIRNDCAWRAAIRLCGSRVLIGQCGARGNNSETMSLNRRNFIAGSAALASDAGARRRLGLGRGRRGDHRRGRGRNRCGAKGRGGGPALRAARGERPHRRALSHRNRHLRRSLRSRRALAARAGHQSAGEARAARLRGLSGAAGAEAAHRQAQRARRRDGGLSRGDRAREPRDPGCGARQGRRHLRAGAAEGSGRVAPGGRILARAVRLRQESRRDLGGGFRALGRARRRCVLPPGARRAGGASSAPS